MEAAAPERTGSSPRRGVAPHVLALVLAGGEGRRLLPLTQEIPKPMVPVAGRPFLERQIDYLAGQGFRRFLILSGYLGDQVRDHFGDGSRFRVEISHRREEELLGTGGALRAALAELQDRFVLLYGDSFLPEDYGALSARFRASRAGGIMVVYRDAESRTGVAPNVALDAAGRVVRYHKGGRGEDLQHIEAGVVLLRASEVARIPPGRPAALEWELYPDLVREGRMEAFVTGRRFYDIGTPEGLRRAERFFLAEARPEGRSP